MSAAKYTPGPLKADGDSVYEASSDDLIAIAFYRLRTTKSEEQDREAKANARLYAAAPALADALEAVKPAGVAGRCLRLDGCGLGVQPCQHCDAVRKTDAALAKAGAA